MTENSSTKGLTLAALGYPQGAVTDKEEVKFLNDANAILANGKK